MRSLSLWESAVREIHRVRCFRTKARSAGSTELPANPAFAAMTVNAGNGLRWWWRPGS